MYVRIERSQHSFFLKLRALIHIILQIEKDESTDKFTESSGISIFIFNWITRYG